jgi:hypothetical protein
MLAQYRSGDVPGALASFGQAAGALREQLGLEPGRELVDLHRAILARDPDLLVNVRPGRPSPSARARQLGVRAPLDFRSSPLAPDANVHRPGRASGSNVPR